MAILEVKELHKTVGTFKLKDFSFTLPEGIIMGLIGENGSGKSTLLNTILGIFPKDTGEVHLFEKQAKSLNLQQVEEVGVVLDECNYPLALTPKQLNNVLKNVYRSWDESFYFNLLAKLQLSENLKLSAFSKGMKMKFSIAAAMSHRPRLLILDEPTSGLDPIIRDEIRQLFLEFVQDESCSILLSSHISADLEKIADHITFIHQGELVFSQSKDQLLEQFGILKCDEKTFLTMDKSGVVAVLKKDYVTEVLVRDRNNPDYVKLNGVMDDAGIDDIMLMHVKGERYNEGIAD